MRFIGRALALILAFSLGFMSFFIAIAAGGFYVYTSLTYNDLVDKGIAPSIDGIVDGENADVDITNSTLQDFVKEFLALQNMGANAITVDSLLNRYQIKLPENIQQYIPDSIRSIAFSDLFTSSGMNTVLENTSLDYAFQYIPDGVLSEPAKETLKGKSFAEVLSMDFENLLQDLKLGYLIGTNYNLVDGVYVIEYQDPDNPSMMELVSDLDLGRVLASVNGHEVIDNEKSQKKKEF